MNTFGAIGILGNKLYEFIHRYEPPCKKSVLVVGYGWGGKAFCDTIDYRKYNVSVISKTDYMLNTPKLKDNIYTISSDLCIDKVATKPFNRIHKEIDDVGELYSIRTKGYDYIVLAIGSVPNDFNIPGVKENCYFLKTVEDLEKLQPALSKKPNKHVVIAGAGPAGIELAFEISKKHNVTLVEAMPSILPSFSESMRVKVIDELAKSNINLLNSTKIKQVQPNYFEVSSEYPSKIPFDVAIWNCGVKPNPLISQIKTPFSVDGHLHMGDNIYAIGDIIASKAHGPPTAQNAKQQGQYLAELFNNDFKGAHYQYNEKGKIIYTKDSILLEVNGQLYILPKWLEAFFDFIVQW